MIRSLSHYAKHSPWIIISIGIILRLIQYISNSSLWLDESLLALNIVNKTFPELFKPLDHWQVAPIGFLVIEKLNVQLFGNNEYVLRLFPLIAGISALFLFYKIVKHVLTKKAVIIAVGLFSLSEYLIYYSSEVKQYSSDVAVALLLYAIIVYIRPERFSIPYIILYGITGAIAIWFSNPSIFILTGIGLILFFIRLTKKDWLGVGKVSTICSIWLLSFAAFYFLVGRSLNESGITRGMQDCWSFSFIPLPPTSFSDFKWYIQTFFGVFQNPVGIHLTGIAALTFLIGCISMFVKNKQWFFILLAPTAITLTASGFHMYPFAGRLLLFIVPSLLVLIAEGVEYIWCKTKSASPLIVSILVGLLFSHPVLYAICRTMEPSYKAIAPFEDIKAVMCYLKEHKKDDDIIYLYYGSKHPFAYYAKRYGFNEDECVIGIYSKDDWEIFIQDLNKLCGKKRVWVLFSHVWTSNGVDEEKLFVYHLDHIGKRLDYFKAKGASIYLYELSKEIEKSSFNDNTF